MITLILIKEIIRNELEMQTSIEVPKLFYKVVKWFYEKKGYEVEELEQWKI